MFSNPLRNVSIPLDLPILNIFLSVMCLVDIFYNFIKLQLGYPDTSLEQTWNRKVFARSEYKSIAQTALYEYSRFVVWGREGGHRTCAPRGSPPENKWDSIEDLIIRLRWKGRLGQNDAETGGRGPIDRSMEHICLDFSIVVRAIRRPPRWIMPPLLFAPGCLVHGCNLTVSKIFLFPLARD